MLKYLSESHEVCVQQSLCMLKACVKVHMIAKTVYTDFSYVAIAIVTGCQREYKISQTSYSLYVHLLTNFRLETNNCVMGC